MVKWIKTSDKYPTVNERVLIAHQVNANHKITIDTAKLDGGGQWRLAATFGYREPIRTPPYWARLPNKPKQMKRASFFYWREGVHDVDEFIKQGVNDGHICQ